MPELRRLRNPNVFASLLVHILALAFMLVAARHVASVVSPLRLAGTRQGTHMMLTYSLGGPAAIEHSAVVRTRATSSEAQKLSSAVPKAPVAPASAVESEKGSGSAGNSALGDEDVHVALPQVHPRPQPDLSVLPHGTAGDVVVDVTIDDAGKVTTATLVKGLGAAVDSSVVQALRGWVFTPATRNGQNIASEQEILIHYERG